MTIQEWIEVNQLDATFLNKKQLQINNETYLIVYPKKQFQLTQNAEQEMIFGENLEIILDDDDRQYVDTSDYILFEFGLGWYYSNSLQVTKLKPFKYIGGVKSIYPQPDFPYLGIHSGYELCNGSRLYDDWVKKAQFYGITTLGICEENTLAGVVRFQQACKKVGIRSIIGESISIMLHNGEQALLKIYVQDVVGWKNLLALHKEISVDKKQLRLTSVFSGDYNLDSLIFVINNEYNKDDLNFLHETTIKSIYYSIDISEWASQEKDILTLENYQVYLQQYKDEIKPILIQDAYYLDKQDAFIQKALNQIGHQNFKNQSKSKWFKNIDELILDQLEICEEDEKIEDLVVTAIYNTIEVFEGIDFSPITGKFYLPQYERNEEEALRSKDNEDLIKQYIEEGLSNLIPIEEQEIYRERYTRELEVIKKGGFIDYFLILCDLYRFAQREDIWVGIGRGSAAGCMVSYLLGIVNVDPIKYNLLFERFLNEGRLQGSLPDIDCDFQGSRRDEIKRYMEERYGYEQISSIGTYGTFKLKNSLKDLCRLKGIDHKKVNYITAMFNEGEQDHGVEFILTEAQAKPLIYSFLQEYPQLIEEMPLIISQNKNSSIHPAGVVISPKEFGPTYLQHPVKKVDDLIVTEWEGDIIDKAGLLKVDILGIKQLDKFADIALLVKKQKGESINFRDIELDNKQVYELFRLGKNQDVFQLGAEGLMNYCKDLQPDNIEDLIATVALYRPGPIESGTHLSYAKRKRREEAIVSDEGCEEVTKSTFGLIIYQEQVMLICTQLANFTLVEADEVRKGLGKKNAELVEKYRAQFLENSINNGYQRSNMEALWEKMAAFASYAFNRSHAACYAITGYYCQWFKVKYPLQFYTVSLQYSEEEQKFKRISELIETTNIQVKAVDINYSELEFTCNIESNTIYWSMTSVKWVGEKVVENILEERNKNGQFFSLSEFLERMKPYSGLNKRALTYLIVCGAFDEIENISEVTGRYKLLVEYYSTLKDDISEEFKEAGSWTSNQWIMKQKDLTGFGFLDFQKAIKQTALISKISKYQPIQELLTETEIDREVIVCGLLVNIIERKYQGTKQLGQLEIKDNTSTIFVTLWDETYQTYKKQLKDSLSKIVVLSGNLRWDDYKKTNSIISNKNTKIESA